MQRTPLTTTSQLNHELIKLYCYLVPSLEENEVLKGVCNTWEKDFSRSSSLEQLCSELEKDRGLDEGSLKFILLNNNQIRNVHLHKNWKPFRREPSPSTVYLYRDSCVKDTPKEPNCCSQCSQTIKQCLSPVLNLPSCKYWWCPCYFRYCCCHCHWWPCKKDANSTPKHYAYLEQSTTIDFSPSYTKRIQRGLFVHVYITAEQERNQISEIKLLGGNARSKFQRINKIINEYEKTTTIKDLVIIKNGEKVDDERSLRDKNCSLVTVMERPSNDDDWYIKYHVKSREVTIRVYIYSTVLDKKYSSNIEHFLNYCDRKKALKLDRHELETALLTLIELFRERFVKSFKEEFYFTYYDLLIPESKDSTWECNDCLLIFADTFVEYIRTRHLLLIASKNNNNNNNDIETEIGNTFTKFMPKFLSCLQETLNDSLKIDHNNRSSATGWLICKRTLTYLSNYLFPFITCSLTIYDKKDLIGQDKKLQFCGIIEIEIFKVICWLCFGFSLFNIIQYYWRSVRSSEVNELEIYWPLALIISTITVINVYQASKAYRDLSRKNNSVQKTYAQAYLTILEAKSKPNKVKKVSEKETHIEKYINEEQLHPTLFQESITQALTFTGSKTVCEYIGSSCVRFILACLIFLLLLGITVSHSLIPYIHHSRTSNESFIVIPWQVNCIRFSYIVYSVIFYFLLILMMIISIGKYGLILRNLKRLLSGTELMQNIDLEASYFLNLREPKNLEYFLSLFRPIQRNIDSYHIFLSTMTCALVIDIILILTAVIHVFVYGHSTDLLTIWCLIDIVFLSIFIILFLAIVVLINKLLMYDLILHLKSLKKTMVTPSSQKGNHNDTISYLDAVIEHMESASKEYAVKLFGFIVDQKLVIKILISVATGIGSTIVSFIKN